MAGSPIDVKYQKRAKRAVVSFRGADLPKVDPLAKYWDELHKLLDDDACEQVVFDLHNVVLLPSGLISFIISLRRYEVDVHLCRCGESLRKTLEMMRLHDLVRIDEIELEG